MPRPGGAPMHSESLGDGGGDGQSSVGSTVLHVSELQHDVAAQRFPGPKTLDSQTGGSLSQSGSRSTSVTAGLLGAELTIPGTSARLCGGGKPGGGRNPARMLSSKATCCSSICFCAKSARSSAGGRPGKPAGHVRWVHGAVAASPSGDSITPLIGRWTHLLGGR